MSTQFEVYRSPHLEKQKADAETITELTAVIEDLTRQIARTQAELANVKADFECYVNLTIHLAEETR